MKNKTFFLGCILLAIVTISTMVKSGLAAARDGAVPVEQGDSKQYRKISISSTSGTGLWVSNAQLVDSICRVNGSGIVWIGSTSATKHMMEHPNITLGFFLMSSETITLGGAYSGADYATCDAGTASCEMRCRDSIRSY